VATATRSARAPSLGQTLYRIHGTNQPSTIGAFVSSGCIRLTNEDIIDLYTRVKVSRTPSNTPFLTTVVGWSSASSASAVTRALSLGQA
jgi:L,D-transpeptidase catalytic domain